MMNRNLPQLSTLFVLILFVISCGVQQKSSTEKPSANTEEKATKIGKAQTAETKDPVYINHTYKESIKSPQLFIKDNPLSQAVIYLNGNKQLTLNFDEMSSEYKTYSYKFIHCNANWKASNLSPSEYIQGFFSGFIENYTYSFNTLFSYIHYSLKFPNQDISFKRSGNYILLVYANNNEEDLILSRRFYVVDEKITIKSSIKMATLARYRDYKQEVDFNILTNNLNIIDPYADLKIIVSQNGRTDNEITDLKPIYVRGNELVYNYEDINLFDGNNEFRYFDTKDLHYQSMNIDGIQIQNGKTHVYVLADEPRSSKRYYSSQDINGKRLIKRDNSQNINTEADYMITHFTLKRKTPVTEGDVYVFGALSDWQFKADFKMNYVGVDNSYELSVPLKQGYYNYAYVVLPKNSTIGDMSIIEGTHSETENDYYIYVYYRQSGEIYDQLIGLQKDNSVKAIK